MDITITDTQLKALRKLDPVLTAKQVVQIHVDTWLAPIVAAMGDDAKREVLTAYALASPSVQTSVRGLLGLG